MGTTIYRSALFATAAAAYILLFVLLLISRRANRTRTTLLVTSAGTAAAAAGIAAGWSSTLGLAGALAELASSGAWCVFALHLLHRQMAKKIQIIRLMFICGILIAVAVLGFSFLVPELLRPTDMSLSVTGELSSRLGLSIFGILLTENLYRNTARDSRWHVNLLCIALGIIFAYGVVVYSDALLFHRVSSLLWDGRAIALLIATPLFAVSAARNRDWAIDIHVSRAVVFHSGTLIGSGIFLLALALTGEVLRVLAPTWGSLAEVALVLAGIAFLSVFLTSGSARSHLRRVLAENFYSHRYDYRQEWMKSIEILSTDPSHTAVQTRVIKAVAEIADSPAGILCVRDLPGIDFQWAGSWNQPAVTIVEPWDGPFIDLFRGGDWVIELDRAPVRPAWFSHIPNAWLAVPLAQRDQLIGFIVLVRPRAPAKPDRETFDLLRIVGRQAATHVAEQRYAQALAEAQDLREYGKRFVFVAHDMKNVASQLKMIVQNARFHADDPEFHRDVLKTVEAALARMNSLLEKLRPGASFHDDRLIVPIEIIDEEVASMRRLRGVKIEVEADEHTASVAMDRAAFRSVIMHLCENAIEACRSWVQIRVRHEALRVQIEVIDRGPGMTAEFIRDKLFQPFGSTKRHGFGIGAYQARELIRAAGGDLVAISRPGTGTTMRILLPCRVAYHPETGQVASSVEVGG